MKNKYKIGDVLEVVDNKGNHDFPIGTHVRITKYFGYVIYQAEYLDGHNWWFIREEDLQPIKENKIEKIAVHVPNKYLSEAVQKALFDNEWAWEGGNETTVLHTRYTALFLDEYPYIGYASIEYARENEYTIISAHKFLCNIDKYLKKIVRIGEYEVKDVDNEGFVGRFATDIILKRSEIKAVNGALNDLSDEMVDWEKAYKFMYSVMKEEKWKQKNLTMVLK
jgi:hypothetical protein